ncbi:MAG: DegV family protein [Bacillota bacterium]|nr:DegV family protein [Bacillota bacterium]
MSKIKIITDSTADLPEALYIDKDIEVLPLLIQMNGKTYTDGIDIDLESLLIGMDSSPDFPATSQVNPDRFYNVYKKYIEEGYQIISIHISSKMSGTYQSALIAKDMINSSSIAVIDSMNVTAGLGILVLKAAELRDKGLSFEEIQQEVIKSIPAIKSCLLFDTLKNLIKGGRIGKAKGTIGHMLNVKLLLSIEDGVITQIGKERGIKKALNKMSKIIENCSIKENQLVIVIHAHNEELKDKLVLEIKKYTSNVIESEVGCVVGVHAGKGAAGIFFIEN